MCARRFLILIFLLTLLIVAAGFAIFQFGDRVLIRQAVPQGHFTAPATGSAPDYAKLENWVARPEIGPDISAWIPSGVMRNDEAPSRAAVFYIHPTTYLQRDRWNAPLSPGSDTELRTRLFVQSQASALAGAGAIWAPRYRQAAYGAFLLDTKDAGAALSLAYADILSAFDRFVAEVPADQPIILAGHSQGALHLLRLLRDRVAGRQLRSRIVAVYAPGWPISVSADLPALGLPACRAPADTGCILSWMTFADPANPELLLSKWEKTKGLAGGDRRQEDMLCVNPITGVLNGTASPATSADTIVPSADLATATVASGVGAHCARGLLILDGAIPAMGPYVLPGNNYHVYDYALFWGAIRRDAERRLLAWRD